MATANGNCYCTLWEKDPKILESQGVPRGYCGMCDSCGQPGHLRHAPISMPYTGAWCDACYQKAVWRGLINWLLFFAVVGIVLWMVSGISRFLLRHE